jgi:AcrR family transcriptional regulator
MQSATDLLPRYAGARRGEEPVYELKRRPALEHRQDVGSVEDQCQAGCDHEIRGVQLRSAQDPLRDPGVDSVERPGEFGQEPALSPWAGCKRATDEGRDEDPSRERALIEEIPEAAVRPDPADCRRVAPDRRGEDPASVHLKRVIRPVFGLLDPGSLFGISREQRRLGVALIQETRDSIVGGDPLRIGCESRHRAEAISDAKRKRVSAADAPLLAARVESVEPRGDWVEQGDHLDTPVRQAFVLEHEHRRAARMGPPDHIDGVHTDWSVGILPQVPDAETRLPARKRNTRVDQRTRAARAQRREARAELLTGALRVFARRGYREAGVDEIAAEAGYSKGALYWHFSGKEELLQALLEERVDAPTRELVALLASSPPERDMSLEAARGFVRQLAEQRDALLLDREYWSLAIRDPELRARYLERQAELRGAYAAALKARGRHLGTPELTIRADDIARIVMAIVGGLTIDELTEPGSIQPQLVSEALAIVYAGLVARARSDASPAAAAP